MTGKKLLLYLIALLVVAGSYFFSEYRHSRQLAEEKAAKEVFQVKASDIKTLTLKNDKGEIDLQRMAETAKPAAKEPAAKTTPSAPMGEWQLTKPITGKTDELTITSLLSELTDLKMQRHLDNVPKDKLHEFGLDKPVFTLEFQAAGKTHQLRFGHKTPGNQSFYAQKDSEPRILLLRVSDKETLDRTLTALRSKSIFSLAPDKVTEIRLIRPDGRLTVHRAAASADWTPENKLPLKLRSDKIKTLLDQVAGARAVEFVAEKADDLKKYGLAPSPALRLTLLAGTQEETLLVGGKQGDRYYAQISGTAPIILVDQALVDKLPASYEALEDRRLWSGAETEVQKMVWGAPDKLVTAVRDQKGWNILSGDKEPARHEAAMKLGLAFWRLKDLEFTKLVPTEAKKEKKPLFTVQLFGPEAKELFQLDEISTGKDQVQVTFFQEGKTVAAVVPAQSFNQLKDALSGLAAPVATKQEKAATAK